MTPAADKPRIKVHLKPGSCDLVLAQIELISTASTLVWQPDVRKGAKQMKSFVVALLYAKFRAGYDFPGGDWADLKHHHPKRKAESWAKTLSTNFCTSKLARIKWWGDLTKKLGMPAAPFPFRVKENGGPAGRFPVSYSPGEIADPSPWAISRMELLDQSLPLTGAALLKLARKLESTEGWNPILPPDKSVETWKPRLAKIAPDSATLTKPDLDHLAAIRPDTRTLFAACRKKGSKARGDELAGFAGEAREFQRRFAEAHRKVAKWRQGSGVNWTPAKGLPDKTAWRKLKAIASKLKLPEPLVLDLAWEFGGAVGKPTTDGLPPLHHGHRSFPLREADETAVLLVPLLEPENPQAGQPVKHKAFRGWLKVERVPVPKWQSGEPLWEEGGNFYPAPAFALLDQDPSFRTALDTAEQYVRHLAGADWRTDCDFRWSLARTDGKALPPVLLGNHLGAAFALALARVAGVRPADGLDPRGATVIGDLDAQGNLRKPGADLAELQRPLAEAARAGALAHLLAAPGIEWASPLRHAPIAKDHASTLDDVAAALRPASVVREHERTETERIEFLTGKMPRKTHYTDVPLLAEVSQARAPKDADGAALTGIALDTEDRRHNANFGFHSQPVDWRGLFTDFARHCPEAAKQAPQPHFVVIGPPGSGKSSLGDHVIWCMAAGEAPFHDEPRLGIRVSLREWEESKHADLAAYLAHGHPGRAAKRSAWPDHSQWDTWLTQGRLALVLDGFDELTVGGDDSLAGRLLHTLLPEWRGRFPLVLTCRTVDVDRYRPQLPDWPIFGPAKFTEAQTRAFIDRYPRMGRKPDGQHNLVTSELMAQLAAHSELLPLAEVPMLLNVICYVVDGGLQLPATKGQLYDQAVDRLLERKPEIKIHPFTQADAPDARRLLAAVAAALFRQNQGPQLLRSDRVNEVLREQLGLAPYTPDDRRAALFRWFIDRSGLLRKSSAGYTFLHNQFYEFLAGEALAADADFGPALAPAITKPDGWREVLKFAAAARLARPPKGGNGQADVCGLLDALAQPRADGRPEFLLLATAVAREVGLKDWDGMDHDHMGTLNRLRQRLEAVRDDRSGLDDAAQIEDEEAAVQKLAALQQARARAASARGWLGGLPKGVGVVPEGAEDALPDIDWLTIPAGPFTMGGEEWWQGGRKYRHRLHYAYRISRFPITHAQWEPFERAGYGERRHWTDAGWAWRENGSVPTRGWPEDYRKWYEGWQQRTRFPLTGRERWGGEFDNPAHPVLVAWYEAAAYARWLTEQLRLKGAIRKTERILLPNEPEWERAARGTDGRLYPWGDAATERELTRRCNWDKTGLRQTSAVSLFSPEGNAPSGAVDMAGNVWEWTRSVWGSLGDNWETARPQYTHPYRAKDGREDENAEPEITRVLRGASWINDVPGSLVASFRVGVRPGFRIIYVGFRLVCVGGFAGG